MLSKSKLATCITREMQGKVDYQRRLSAYMDCMEEDEMIFLQTTQDVSYFTPGIGEEYFIMYRPLWV